MCTNNTPSHKRRNKCIKKASLIAFVSKQPYIDIKEQPKVCQKFGLPFMRTVFQIEYRKRFYNYLLTHTTTVATVERQTKIPQKFLTCCKLYYEKRDLLQVVGLGTCPTTQSKKVQFLSTNPKEWGTFKNNSNQLELF